MLLKKGAMFGLDARIALAIFGALSVISGAALYSAIQQSKVTALATELTEITKAVEQYVLDVGEDINLLGGGVGTTLAYQELMESTKPGWKGPYLSYEGNTTNGGLTHFKHQYYDRMAIDLKVSAEDGFTACVDPASAGKNCYYWVFLGDMDDSLKKAIDLHFDGTEDLTKGIIHTQTHPTGIYYRAFPSLKKY